MCVLVREKEKVLRQMDQLLQTSKSSKVETPVRFLVRPATAVSLKENVSVMSNNMTPAFFESGDSDVKKELTMLRKEMKKMVDL